MIISWRRFVVLMLSGAAGVFISYDYWFLAIPAQFASVFLFSLWFKEAE